MNNLDNDNRSLFFKQTWEFVKVQMIEEFLQLLKTALKNTNQEHISSTPTRVTYYRETERCDDRYSLEVFADGSGRWTTSFMVEDNHFNLITDPWEEIILDFILGESRD
jgi:hypothetical protein